MATFFHDTQVAISREGSENVLFAAEVRESKTSATSSNNMDLKASVRTIQKCAEVCAQAAIAGFLEKNQSPTFP